MDLDSQEAIDYGQGLPFVPWGTANYEFSLISFDFKEGFNGKAYQAEVLVDSCDSSDDEVNIVVKQGKRMVLHWPLVEGNGPDVIARRNAETGKLRNFLAAVEGEDSKSTEFKATDALKSLLKANKEGKLESGALKIKMSRVQRTTKNNKQVSSDKFEPLE